MSLYTELTMFASLTNRTLESLSDVLQNPIALIIFGIISLLIALLILATLFPFWRRTLVSARLLEREEHPTSLLVWIISIVIIVKLVQIFVVQPFIVDGGSMIPTFHDKEFLLVDKLSYRIHDPARGDVAIFKLYEPGASAYAGKYLIKRVIGLPGERVVIQNGVTKIFNAENPEGFVIDESYVIYKDTTKNVDLTLDENHYFMMGDNRAQSYDSRDWGPLDKNNMRGQVLFRVYPFNQTGYEPGQHHYAK
jgi:signal peptidase I